MQIQVSYNLSVLRPGNYLRAYEVEWTVMLGGSTTLINNDTVMEPFSLNQMDFSLSVELNPFSVGTYQCRVKIMSDSPQYNNHCSSFIFTYFLDWKLMCL